MLRKRVLVTNVVALSLCVAAFYLQHTQLIGQSRSERIQYAGLLGLGAIGVSIGSGMTERRNLHGSSDSD